MNNDAGATKPMSAIKLALAAQRLRNEAGGANPLQSEPIAIVGLGCQFPGGASSPELFWRVLEQGTDAVREISADRWNIEALYDPDSRTPGKMSTRWAGLLDNIDKFDAEFFGIAPRESARMDPQQRLLLEVTWEALNDSGYPPESLGGSDTGVFFAVYNNDYARLQFRQPSAIDAHTSSGTSHAIAAGRLSYLLNLHGPSLAIDTACSSSLVAIHVACQSLRTGECALAVAGGVNLMVTPEETISLSKWGMLAPDGRCKTFDAAANGFVRGEGCGIIVLKRLGDALAAGDRIHALIRGSAVNQDGRSTVLTAPNGLAQQAVLQQALKNARISASQISYVEAHGTGTSVGDPIEVEALAAVIGQPRSDGSSCRLGSVKTNFGHLEAAAGVAGLIKVVLAMQHQAIPPHLHFKKLNPLISLDGTCLRIGNEGVPWTAGAAPRFAGVSSFGFGGTNAHVVLEEAPRLPERSKDRVGPQGRSLLLPLSARSQQALSDLVRDYAGFLDGGPVGRLPALENICYTASVRRWHYPVRAAFVGETKEEIAARLKAWLEQSGSRSDSFQKTNSVTFVFSGHGSQWIGMGRRLLETEPVFRDAMARCDAAVQSVSGWSVLKELAAPEDQSHLDQTEYFQPVLFALQTSLAALWRSWGIVPGAVLGHSVGEIAAAHVAGAITLEDAARIAVHRGRVMQSASGTGAMAAVELSSDQAKAFVAERGLPLTLAAINGPRSVTLSGESETIDRFLAELRSQGIPGRRLKVNCAFHSPAMVACAETLVRQLTNLVSKESRTSIYSTVHGSRIAGSELDSAYWGRNVRDPVQFATAMQAAIKDGCGVFLEISPHPVLASAIKQCSEANATNSVVLPSLRRGQDERTTLFASLGALYELGLEVRWNALYPGGGSCVSLPTYPWQRERHWSAPVESGSQDGESFAEAPWPGRIVNSAFFDGSLLECEISSVAPGFVNDHRICGVATLPATGMIDLALLAAWRELTGEKFATPDPSAVAHGRGLVLEDLVIHNALLVPDQVHRILQLGFRSASAGNGSFELFSRAKTAGSSSAAWTLHANGSTRLASVPELRGSSADEIPNLDRAKASCSESVDVGEHYNLMRGRGVEFGPSFCGVEKLWRGPQFCLAQIKPPETYDSSAESHFAHPALLDACLQAIAPATPVNVGADGSPSAYLPVAIERLWASQALSTARWSLGRIRSQPAPDAESLIADVWIYSQAGEVVGEIQGLRLQRTERRQLAQITGSTAPEDFHEVVWDAQPLNDREGDASVKLDGRCLIFADQRGVAQRFAEKASARGADCILVHFGEGFAWRGDGGIEISSAKADDYCRLLKELRASDQWPVRDVVHMAGLDLPSAASGGARVLADEQVNSVGSVLHLVQAIAEDESDSIPKLWLVSSSAIPIPDGCVAVEPTQAPVWGLGRVISLEHPELRCANVDLPGGAAVETRTLDQFCDELCAPDRGEDRVAFSDGRRLVARLRPLKRNPASRTEPDLSEMSCTALHRVASGVLEELHWQPSRRRAPAAGEVEIQVVAAGLNFRDVLVALKMVEGRGERLGGECAGRIVAVGPGIGEFRVGDEVVAFAIGSLASYVTISEKLVMRKPKSVSLQAASALPVVFLTALYAFRHVAPLRPGQRVLIHAAAGGVGSAAVQLAKLAGAEIFGTAGSPEKRALLKSWGVSHVFDSRSLAFPDEIRAIVGERGLDVVLNSLAGEFASRSLDLVRAGGTFVELGKRDILDPREVARNHDGVKYVAYDLADVAEQDPQLIQSLLTELNELIGSGKIQLPPTQYFPAASVAAAFRHMAQGRHTGKIVIQIESQLTEVPARKAGEKDGAWLITGGLGGLGLNLAGWLVNQGYKRVALIGRRLADDTARQRIAEWQRAGATVETYSADVSDRSQLGEVLAQVRQQLGPLRGIVHAAGVLDDGTITQLDWPRCRSVLMPKVDGAWNLHALTLDDRLDAFVMFSSAASVLGSSGQGNYAAANAFLDALAHYRRGQGLPALSVNWGAWATAGMVSQLAARDRERLAARGMRPIALEEGFVALQELLKRDAVQAVFASADWRRYAQSLHGAPPALLRELVQDLSESATSQGPATTGVDFLSQLEELPAAKRLPRVLQFVEMCAARALGLAPGKPLDPRRPLHELGLDSLMSVELRNALATSLGRSLPATLLFDYPTVESLTQYLARDVLKLDLADRVVSAERGVHDEKGFKQLEQMSEAEAESLLLSELNQLKK